MHCNRVLPRIVALSRRSCALCTSRNASSFTGLSSSYVPSQVESRWQSRWQREAAAMRVHNELDGGEEKFYMLSMFPYPSGWLHMGHVRVYTISDTLAHFHRMRGKKVLHPMGWDSFGLPAENAAIERGIDPAKWTKDNIFHMRSQLNSLGCHFDWHRVVSTCSPDYYKWTQWLFLQLYQHGLAYKKEALVNWDPVDQTVLANEQVDSSGHSWRSGAMVEQKYLRQWFFKITAYTEPLLAGLEDLDWPGSVKTMQANWIGKSEGTYFDFQLQGVDHPPLRVFTTRPDTIFGASFLAVSPEHELLENTQLFSGSTLQAIRELQRETQLERTIEFQDRPKRGIPLGLHAIHPFTGVPIPVYVADYVISDYGTKAVVGVPAHDERDLQLAVEHSLPAVRVIEGEEEGEDGGVLVHSEGFSGMSVKEGTEAIIRHAHTNGFGGHMTQYKLRDWLISRQRYWGAPIPVIYCDNCGIVPVAGESLPVLLPSNIQFTGRGPSPLSQAQEWQATHCNKCGCQARRDTDTMDTFVDSSWYFLRYINPNCADRAFTEAVNTWMPVDLYVGGIEHAIGHLLYARFINHFLHDIGLVKDREPFKKLLTQGMVQGKTYRLQGSGQYLKPEEQVGVREGDPGIEVSWEKMSKSKYNGVDPEDIVREYGADTVRLFMLFKAPPELAIQWDIQAIRGVHRWLHRVWTLCQQHKEACKAGGTPGGPENSETKRKVVSATHNAIKQVTLAIGEKFSFNVAVAKLMILSNVLRDSQDIVGSPEYHEALATLCKLLAPKAPHIASELWEGLKEACLDLGIPVPQGLVLEQDWPQWNEDLIEEETVEVVLKVDGRKRGVVVLSAQLTKQHQELEREALRMAQDKGILRNRKVTKIFVAPHGKVVNFVTHRV